jgi:hypothetical protein
MDELVVGEGFDHEQGKVHAARDVALENGVTHMFAPHRQALTVALLQVTAPHYGPPGVAGEDPPARFHLVVEVGEASEFRQGTGDLHERLELPRIHVLAVARDVPPAREHQAGRGTCVVEHRLGRSGRVVVDPSRNQHGQHAVAPGNRTADDVAVVCRSRNDGDPALERVELAHAAFPAHADDLVATVQRVLHHVLP